MTDNNRYKIIKQLGSGGMATVFLARDERIGREVALKKLHPHLLSNPETVRRFTNEASAIAKISHENIIKIFDCDNTDRDRFIVMEHIQGQTLLEILNTTHRARRYSGLIRPLKNQIQNRWHQLKTLPLSINRRQ